MGILRWWSDRSSGMASSADRQRIDEFVERVVQTTNPKLRFARDYRKRLRPVVATSLAHVRNLVASMPPVREASAAAWSGDAYMQTFFATADSLVQVFSRSPDLRAHFERNPLDDDAYAVLGMEMNERKTLGMALEGGAVRGDVAQTTISFGDHAIRIVGCNESDLRTEIEQRLIDQLALAGLADVIADQSRRKDLEHERALLKSRLLLQERNGVGMSATLGGDDMAPGETARLRSQLEDNTKELDNLGHGAELLDRELDSITKVLASPAEYLSVASRRMRLDRMNIMIDEKNNETGHEFEFLVARLPGNTPPRDRAFSLVRFPRAELLPTRRFSDDAARFLG